MNWYWPRVLESVLFDYALYVGGAKDHAGDEALRRNAYEHGTWIRDRGADEPWITPLMELKCVDMRKSAPRQTDLFLITRGLLMSERAREALMPVAGPGVHFLPVEVVNGPPLWWAMGPVVPQALDREKSRITMLGDEVTAITQPVVFRDKMPETGFVSLDPVRARPVLSATVAKVIAEADLFGAELCPVDEV